jgi:hypothetical protein
MTCEEVDEALLAEHLLGGLGRTRERELEAHLSACRRCASELHRLRGLLGKLRRMGAGRAAPERPERVVEIMAAVGRVPAAPMARRKRPVWPWAAAAGALAAAILLAVGWPSSPEPGAVPVARAAPRPAQAEPAPVLVEPAPVLERPALPAPRIAPPISEPDRSRVEPETKPPVPARPEPVPAPEAAPLARAEPPRPEPLDPARDKPLDPARDEPPRETIAFAAALEEVRGEVFRVGPDGAARAMEGEGLLPGQGLQTRGAPSAARVKYADGTRLEIGPDSVVRDLHDLEPKGPRGKRVFLAQGALIASVARQPAGRSMVLSTPHAESAVLGTSLRLVADATSTRLEVREGRVRFARASGKAPLEVRSGQYAVAGAGVEPAAKPLALAEILLLPQNGHVAGKVWQLVRDPEAAAEQAFEALRTPSRGEQIAQGLPRAPRVSFSFPADPEITYYVWMRGRAGPGAPPQDSVFVEVPGARFAGQPPMDLERLGGSTERALFEGFGQHPAYVWIGGDEQDGRHDLPVRLRFGKPGLQTLTLHADETPIRIDAIWISATQATRPDPGLKGPWHTRK